MGAPPGPPRPWGRFPTTRWSTILRARESEQERRAALEEILSIYWKPFFIYLRRKGYGQEDAEDAVQ